MRPTVHAFSSSNWRFLCCVTEGRKDGLTENWTNAIYENTCKEVLNDRSKNRKSSLVKIHVLIQKPVDYSVWVDTYLHAVSTVLHILFTSMFTALIDQKRRSNKSIAIGTD